MPEDQQPPPDEERLEDLELDEDDEEITERVRGGRRARAISIPY